MNLPGINNSHPAIKPYCVETLVASEVGYGFINESSPPAEPVA